MGLSNEHKASSQKGMTAYYRFKIETSDAPPRKKEPRPFNPHVSKIGLAKVLLHEVIRLGPKLRRREYRKYLLSRPCIYGTFSGRLGGFHPIKDRCTGCMRCVQEYPGICNVDRNPDFFKFPDSYWMPDDPATSNSTPVSTVLYEAATGKIPVKGMGYKGSFAGRGWDAMWTDMSEIVRPTRDGVYGREYISTLVDLGRKQKFLRLSSNEPGEFSNAIEIPMPILFDYLPQNLNWQSIILSIATAAERTGTLFIHKPSDAIQPSDCQLGNMIPLLEPSDVSDQEYSICSALAVELTEGSSSAMQRIRELNPKAPLIIRLPLGRSADRKAVELAQGGADAVHLCANYHGEAEDGHGFVGDQIRSVHCALVREALRDEVTLISSGGITLAEHVPKAIICGADLVALDTTILVALQTEFAGECRSPDEGRIIPENFDPAWGAQRLVNLLASWHDQLIEILSAMGMRDVRRLRGDVGRAMFNADLEKEAFADIRHVA